MLQAQCLVIFVVVVFFWSYSSSTVTGLLVTDTARWGFVVGVSSSSFFLSLNLLRAPLGYLLKVQLAFTVILY